MCNDVCYGKIIFAYFVTPSSVTRQICSPVQDFYVSEGALAGGRNDICYVIACEHIDNPTVHDTKKVESHEGELPVDTFGSESRTRNVSFVGASYLMCVGISHSLFKLPE